MAAAVLAPIAPFLVDGNCDLIDEGMDLTFDEGKGHHVHHFDG